jgi:glycosyltransferase involved in cell wall biosynthesis
VLTVDVTTLIATYNRARLLRDTLSALGAQQVPSTLVWEILVVDNNSRDQTRQVVDTFAATTAVPVRYVFEPRQGLSAARNRGIQEARGSIIAFTDDDVLPAPDWVTAVLNAFTKWNADAVGGRILPRRETSPPPWLARDPYLLALLALMDLPDGGLLALPLNKVPQVDKVPQVWGANMAFRRKVFEQVGGFDIERCMVGNKLIRGDEVELMTRALERGLRIAYDPSLTVFHRIGRDRVRRGYFCKMAFDDAQHRARFLPAPVGRTFRGAPLWMYRAVVAEFWTCLGYYLARRSDAFSRWLDWFSLLGRLSGYRRRFRSRTRS